MRAWRKGTTANLVFAVFAGVAVMAWGNPIDVTKGQNLFERRCSGCHSPDKNMEGPMLRGVYGRRAAAVPGFGYSDGLKKLNLTWDDASLDRWLKDPEAVVPDTDMAFRLADQTERQAVIAYLKSLGKITFVLRQENNSR